MAPRYTHVTLRLFLLMSILGALLLQTLVLPAMASSMAERFPEVADLELPTLALAIFVLACFVGYYVVWSVTPALHTPQMAVTNAISSVIIVGGLIAAAAVSGDVSGPSAWIAKGAGVVAVTLASVNIFGGFMVTRRMLAMYRKKEKPKVEAKLS